MTREGLIKLTGEDNLFYDSVEKVYRYRMHCPKCKKISGCQCFEDLEEAEHASIYELDYCCTYKCTVMEIVEHGAYDIDRIMSSLEIKKDIKNLTEEDAMSIVDEIGQEIDIDDDYIGGESCQHVKM
jgi:hypothetical protein